MNETFILLSCTTFINENDEIEIIELTKLLSIKYKDLFLKWMKKNDKPFAILIEFKCILLIAQ